jgi:hypothetical protein
MALASDLFSIQQAYEHEIKKLRKPLGRYIAEGVNVSVSTVILCVTLVDRTHTNLLSTIRLPGGDFEYGIPR